jgi:putative Holliday junction resolvase
VKVLAIDHGEARTGLAVSDPTGTISRPLSVVRRVTSPAGWQELLDVVAAEAPDRVIVGDPRTLGGDRGRQSRSAEAFANRLAKAVDIPVELQDERLTTVEATRRKREGGSRERIDSLAACVLLDAYLARVA